MQKIPIIGIGKDGPALMILRSKDIVKIERLRHHEYQVHTKEDSYILDVSMETLEEWLYEEGFRLLDRNNLVNIHHISEYDLLKGRVYFGDSESQKTKSATLARSQYKHLETLLRLLKLSDEQSFQQVVDEAAAIINHDTELDYDQLKIQRSFHTLLDVADRQRTEARIKQLAYHDALTGLPNRLLLQERMKETFKNSDLSGSQTAVFFLDLDRIKVINDTLGHHVGDQVLIHWASCMNALVAPYGLIARFSGDEFIILLPDVPDLEFVRRFAESIMQLFHSPFLYSHHELYSTASIGISLYPQDGIDPETLLKYADSAMYKAKGQGGNTFEFYNSELDERSLDRLNLEIDLRKAVERGEIVVYYQPIVTLETGRMIGMEALMRWKHPVRGLISPMDFIPLAEETGLIVSMGNWILFEACRQNREWEQKGFPPVCVSVNISVKQFQSPQFVHTVQQALQITGLDPRLLCLEITENVAMTNVAFVVRTINELRELGVAISIDDFGTGYSSLSYLKRFRVHTLKIDKSFIQEVNTNDESAAIVTALLAMSRGLNIRTLAEGVETAEQLAFLQQHGCNEIQGYLFSKPLPADIFQTLLEADSNFLESIG
ncbi:MAG: sensor-containing diguanylate cyclase/phosphodiesterase [Paenibacillus sp.]|nr:sensor-containing diguanylate cyclase/phosphodiesterase [Paenibacillus sp.]